jgi:cytochrome c5
MKNRISAPLLVILVCCFQLAASPQTPPKTNNPARTAGAKASSQKEGQKRFRENCGRCHNPPESLSPREVKAVMQHMRVRAMLGSEDEQLILKYLAP